jgi:pyruvate/2-oxoglutarate dehydrogenase complex dihydrolipoamide dehydrogenase (E3) component
MKTDVLIIGGSAAGLMAGITARKHYPDKKVTLVRKEEKVLIPCGIPYTLHTVDGPENNIIADQAVTGNGIDLIINEVVEINRDNKKVILKDGEEITYEKLVLGVGSQPLVPPIEGVDLKNVYTVKKDFDLLKEMREKVNKKENIVIIGGGFIGVEFADEIRKNPNTNVTIIEILDNVLSLVCDDDLCLKAEEKLKENGVNLLTNSKVVSLKGNKEVKSVVLENGEEINADMVVIATGVVPNTKLAEKANLNYDKRQGIMVDEYMRTNDPDIFACGDCVEKPSYFGENFKAAWLASIATNEGRVVGANLYNLRRKKQKSIGIFSTIVDNMALGVAGLTKKQAEEAGIEVVVGHAEAVNRHPGTMPGAQVLGATLIFQKYDGKLIGAQVYGADSAGEFLNILGLAIEKQMTAEDLATLQVGTHPALTSSPVPYQLINAAEDAATKLNV